MRIVEPFHVDLLVIGSSLDDETSLYSVHFVSC
jgi:hypothetical protein